MKFPLEHFRHWPEQSDSLVIIWESSWRREEIPEEGRRANTVSVFKGEEEELGNYTAASSAWKAKTVIQ